MYTRTAVTSATALAVAASVALATPADAAAKRAAAPAESTRVLPLLAYPASAVDAAGGSLVVGEFLGDARTDRSVRAYYRRPSGSWVTSVPVVTAKQYGGDVTDVAVSAGPSGSFVIAWVVRVNRTSGFESTVRASTRSASGAISAPVTLFSRTSEEAQDDRLRLVTNDAGDAAATLPDATKVARLVRSTGAWTTYDVPATDAKRQVDLMLSASRTADLTYATGSGPETRIRQLTLTAAATAFAAPRDLPAPSPSSALRFDVAMDASGIQTLIVGTSGTDVYREDSRRGTFVLAFDDDIEPNGTPHVASRGRFTRVLYTTFDEQEVDATRLYDGTSWGSRRTYGGFSANEKVARPLAIGTTGRGVFASFGGQDSDGSQNSDRYVQRTLLETSSATTQDVTVNSTDVPALDVGPTGVSQLVISEYIVVDFKAVSRTVVYVRR